MWTLIKSGISAVFPPAGLALKFGPYAIIAALAAFIMFQHVELQRDAAQVLAASAQTAQAITKCQQEASTQAAIENAVTAQKLIANQGIDNAVSASVMASRQVAANAQTAQAAAIVSANATIDKQAATAGQDGPIPPVLAEQFP